MADDSFQPFTCGECGSIVDMRHPTDDFLIMRLQGFEYQIVIPEHLLIPKCSYCGTVYLGYSQAEALAIQMGGTFQ